MANSFDFVDWLAMEGLRLLTNPLVLSPYFNTDYNGEFQKEFAVGETVRVPFPKMFIGTETLAYSPEAIIDRHTDITVDKIAAVHFEWDSVEKALKMPKSEEAISRDILKPAMMVIRQKIESACALYAYQRTPNFVGILGTNPTTFDAIFGAAGERMSELSASPGDRGMFLSPKVTRALRASTVAQFNPADEMTRQWKKGVIGEANGFTTFESNSLWRHTSGVWAGTVEMLAAGQSGASLSLTATTGDTFKVGDKFHIAAVYDVNPMTLRSTGTLKQFTVLANATAAASAATISVYPAIVGPGSPYQNVDALPAAGADLTMFTGTAAPTTAHTGTVGLALGKNAFGLVGVRLANPKAAEMSSYARDPKSGISISFLRMFDGIQRKWINRFDCLYGLGTFYADHEAVAVLSA